MPPFHPNCRCTIVGHFRDMVETERVARVDGKSRNVGNISYTEWKKRFVETETYNDYVDLSGVKFDEIKPIEEQSDEQIRDWIKHHEKKLNHEKYEEHDKNSSRYDGKKSYLIISEEETQQLIYEKAGTGELRRDRKGSWTKKEFIINESDVEFFISKDGNLRENTNRFSINYNNRGEVHIIPRRRLND